MEQIENNVAYVLSWWTVSTCARGLFWCLFPELRSKVGNKHQNNTRVSAWTVRHEITYNTLFLTRHNESINYYSRISLAQFSFWWWRHNRLLMTSQWPDKCDAITWIVISNSIDILFTAIFTAGRLGRNVSMTTPSHRNALCITGAHFTKI